VLPFYSQSDTGMTVLLKGVELGTFNVPLHKVCLKSPLVSGTRIRHFLPVQEVDIIQGNDLAGGKVVANPHVPHFPCNDNTPELFSASAVTWAMSKAASQSYQSTSDVPAVEGNPLEGVTGTILDDEAPNAPRSTSAEEAVSQVKDPGLLLRESLIIEQEGDKEIRQLLLHAVDENRLSWCLVVITKRMVF